MLFSINQLIKQGQVGGLEQNYKISWLRTSKDFDDNWKPL